MKIGLIWSKWCSENTREGIEFSDILIKTRWPFPRSTKCFTNAFLGALTWFSRVVRMSHHRYRSFLAFFSSGHAFVSSDERSSVSLGHPSLEFPPRTTRCDASRNVRRANGKLMAASPQVRSDRGGDRSRRNEIVDENEREWCPIFFSIYSLLRPWIFAHFYRVRNFGERCSFEGNNDP